RTNAGGRPVIVTLKVLVARLPDASVARQVTSVVPIGNVAPLSGVHAGVVTVRSTVSLAVAENGTAWRPHAPSAPSGRSAGPVTSGAVVPLTVTRKLRAIVSPALVTEQVTSLDLIGKTVPARLTGTIASFAPSGAVQVGVSPVCAESPVVAVT